MSLAGLFVLDKFHDCGNEGNDHDRQDDHGEMVAYKRQIAEVKSA